MTRYRHALPQLDGGFFMTDGGIETTLIFHEGHELPHFAAFHLFEGADGEEALRTYFRTYGELARQKKVGLILETPTWRASADWGKVLDYGSNALAAANRKSVELLEAVRDEFETDATPIVISGCIGPRGDGYVPGELMSEDDARAYHRRQIEQFAATSADLVTAITMTTVEEATGVALAAGDADMPVVISFTLETDGNLPTGQSLGEAIAAVDAATGGYPAYYMINCAHPSHFEHGIQGDEPWISRLRGLRANASKMSHAELDEAPELDEGDPAELGEEYATLKRGRLPHLNVMGGCCGTDHRHVGSIASACAPLFT